MGQVSKNSRYNRCPYPVEISNKGKDVTIIVYGIIYGDEIND